MHPSCIVMHPETGLPLRREAGTVLAGPVSACFAVALPAAGLSGQVRRLEQGEQRLMIGGLDDRYRI